MRFNPLRLKAGLKGYEGVASLGDRFEHDIPEGVTEDNLTQHLVHVAGMIQVVKTGAEDTVRIRIPGDSVLRHGYPRPGVRIFTVLSDEYRCYCLSKNDESPIRPSHLESVDGGPLVVSQGTTAVLVMGSVQANGVTYVAPSQFVARNSSIDLAASPNTMLVSVSLE